MDQIEMYKQVLVIFWSLLLLGIRSSAVLHASCRAMNKICGYCGMEPQDPAVIREIGEECLDKIAEPFFHKVAVPGSLTQMNITIYGVVAGAFTIIITTAFQLVTIPTVAGLSIMSANVFDSTFSVTTASFYLVAFSMVFSVGLFTHIYRRALEGAHYA